MERSDAAFWDRRVLFRDYLRAHPGVAERYTRLKYEVSDRFREDRAAYTGAKTDFIAEVIHLAEKAQD